MKLLTTHSSLSVCHHSRCQRTSALLRCVLEYKNQAIYPYTTYSFFIYYIT